MGFPAFNHKQKLCSTCIALAERSTSRVAADQIPSSSKSPAKLQTDLLLRLHEGLCKPFTHTHEVCTYCCKEQPRLSLTLLTW